MFWIKWLLSGKSLKQLFIIGLISCFTLLVGSFVNAACSLRQIRINGTYIDNVVNIASGIHPVGTTYQSSNSSSYSIGVLRYGNFFTQSLGYGKKVFSPVENSMIWFDSDGLPYVYNNQNIQGNFSRYAICNEIDGSSTYLTGCSLNSLSSSSVDVFKSFLSTVNSSDSFGYYYYRSNYANYFDICISSSQYHKSLCFLSDFSNVYGCDGYCCPVNSKGYTSLTFSNISQDILFDSPGVSSSSSDNNGYENNNGGIDLSTPSSALNYYETRYGFNKNICYVGVDSMSYIWGDSVSFNEGAGLTIFEAFNSLYGNTDLDKVYVWINNWILNYEQRFGNDGNPMYLSNYNSGTNQVDIYYDNLSFPFAGNPVAVYFMSDYIEQVAGNSLYDPSGSAVVSYCNLKINDGTFEQIIDQSDKNNITKYTENFNTNKGLNADGTEKDYGAWLSSGVELAFSGDTSLKNSLKEFLDETENNISSLKDISDSIVGHILPVWIITPFVFFALFRFIRKH